MQATDRIVDVYPRFAPLQQVTFANTTCLEGCRVMVMTPRRGMGRYESLSVDGDSDSAGKFDSYFSKFTPNQSDWYFRNLQRQMLEAFLLNFLYKYAVVQVRRKNYSCTAK